MTALGPDGTAYGTQGEAEVILQRLFNGVHSQMVGLNTETRGLVDQLRLDVQQAITERGEARGNTSQPIAVVSLRARREVGSS